MVKHTQTIHRHQPTNCLSVFDHFVNLALKGVSNIESSRILLSCFFCFARSFIFNPSSAKFTKCSNTLNNSSANCRWNVWVWLTILWVWPFCGFHRKSTLCSCENVKEPLFQNMRDIWTLNVGNWDSNPQPLSL